MEKQLQPRPPRKFTNFTIKSSQSTISCRCLDSGDCLNVPDNNTNQEICLHGSIHQNQGTTTFPTQFPSALLLGASMQAPWHSNQTGILLLIPGTGGDPPPSPGVWRCGGKGRRERAVHLKTPQKDRDMSRVTNSKTVSYFCLRVWEKKGNFNFLSTPSFQLEHKHYIMEIKRLFLRWFHSVSNKLKIYSQNLRIS